jgi:hypothetical protein
MAKAMMRAVDDVGVHYSADGVLEPYLETPENGTAVEDFEPSAIPAGDHLSKPRRCLEHAYRELELGDEAVSFHVQRRQ